MRYYFTGIANILLYTFNVEGGELIFLPDICSNEAYAAGSPVLGSRVKCHIL